MWRHRRRRCRFRRVDVIKLTEYVERRWPAETYSGERLSVLYSREGRACRSRRTEEMPFTIVSTLRLIELVSPMLPMMAVLVLCRIWGVRTATLKIPIFHQMSTRCVCCISYERAQFCVYPEPQQQSVRAFNPNFVGVGRRD